MTIIELGVMGVQPGKSPMDPDTADGKMLHAAWRGVVEAPGGPGCVYYGLEQGEEERMWAFFEWESLEQHSRFAEDFGAQATKDFGTIFTPGFTKHVHLDMAVLREPVTQIVLAFFPPDVSKALQTSVAAQFDAFCSTALAQCGGVRGVSCGWGVEKDFPVRNQEGKDGEGSLFVGLVGWGSVGECVAFEETSGFEEDVKRVVLGEGCVQVSVFCLRCSVMEKERLV